MLKSGGGGGIEELGSGRLGSEELGSGGRRKSWRSRRCWGRGSWDRGSGRLGSGELESGGVGGGLGLVEVGLGSRELGVWGRWSRVRGGVKGVVVGGVESRIVTLPPPPPHTQPLPFSKLPTLTPLHTFRVKSS